MVTDDSRPGPTPHDIMRETSTLRKLFEAITESNGLHAKILKANFDALIREGFTPAQALEIICKRGPHLGGSS